MEPGWKRLHAPGRGRKGGRVLNRVWENAASEGGSLRLGVIGKGESVVELATLMGLWLEGGLGRKRRQP